MEEKGKIFSTLASPASVSTAIRHCTYRLNDIDPLNIVAVLDNKSSIPVEIKTQLL